MNFAIMMPWDYALRASLRVNTITRVWVYLLSTIAVATGVTVFRNFRVEARAAEARVQQEKKTKQKFDEKRAMGAD